MQETQPFVSYSLGKCFAKEPRLTDNFIVQKELEVQQLRAKQADCIQEELCNSKRQNKMLIQKLNVLSSNYAKCTDQLSMKSCEIDNLNQIIACNENEGSQLKKKLSESIQVIFKAEKKWKLRECDLLKLNAKLQQQNEDLQRNSAFNLLSFCSYFSLRRFMSLCLLLSIALV